MPLRDAPPPVPTALKNYKPTATGTTLAEVRALASNVGLSMIAVRREAGAPFITPAVVYLGFDHLSAVLEEVDGRFRVRDLCAFVSGNKSATSLPCGSSGSGKSHTVPRSLKSMPRKKKLWSAPFPRGAVPLRLLPVSSLMDAATAGGHPRNIDYRTCAAIVPILCLLIGAACTQPPVRGQRVRPDALIVLPGAIDVRDTDENEATVAYELKVEYPAKSVTDAIRDRLENTGWRPLKGDFMNPGSLPSHVRGWVNFEDRTKPRPTDVYQWAAQWEDDSKRIVWYVLTYEAMSASPPQAQAKDRLRVSATLLSADTAKALRDAAAKSGVPK